MRINQSVKVAVLVRALRNAFNMSQATFASISGTSRPTINRIESLDGTSPRSDTVDDLLQVFRDMGVEIQVGDEDVTVRFKRQALEAAESYIKGDAQT